MGYVCKESIKVPRINNI
jgi:hypothetical protein